MKKCFLTAITAGVVFLGIQLSGCEKKTDDIVSDPVEAFLPMQTGKYVIYLLDSTRFVNFGQKDTTVTYFAKDTVEGPATDNLGRAGWRVVRYLRDTASGHEADWNAVLTYQVIPGQQKIEVKEGNFRYIKLAIPVKDGFSWRGNGYIPSNPYGELFEFSNDEDIQTWDYTYQDVGVAAQFGNKNYDSTITVVQIADSTNLPLETGIPASKTYWVEKYAKNIGLVYKEVEIWEYQPPTTTSAAYKQGFGLKMTIVDHN
ncbi:hypothetical protein [Longitalea luteola]|uniref:hypothetical protein n=1 Tax=Longitalea luteola TaxID=2812563 RepID=UPI001A9774AA|nr:hypothetical protein [Longitalea luteola]